MSVSDRSLLAKISLFAGLEAAPDGPLAEVRWRRYPRRHQIVSEGDPTTDVFFVAEGAIQARSIGANGKAVTYAEVHAGGLFGEFAAIDGEARSASIVTTEPSAIGRMEGAAFKAVLLANPDLHMRVTELLVHKARDLSRRIYEYSMLSVCGRIHAELLRLAEEAAASGSGVVIEPAPTHQELASRIATHREAVTREFNYLESAGVLTTSRRRIEIHDIDRLRAMFRNLSAS